MKYFGREDYAKYKDFINEKEYLGKEKGPCKNKVEICMEPQKMGVVLNKYFTSCFYCGDRKEDQGKINGNILKLRGGAGHLETFQGSSISTARSNTGKLVKKSQEHWMKCMSHC